MTSSAVSGLDYRSTTSRRTVSPPSPRSGLISSSGGKDTAPVKNPSALSASICCHASAIEIFATIGRSDLANVLDEVAGNHGTAQADHSLKIFAAIASWWAARDDSYQSPIVRGLRRGKTVKRARILNDGEIRAVWRTCDAAGSAGAFLQFALLCGQRYGKIATMRWDDLDGDVWIIRQDVREKGTAGFLKLPPAARSIIKRQPRISGKDCIFGPLHNRVLAHIRQSSGVADWTIHDLRRSARTLLSRAGVQSEVAERVLGHVIGGVEGVYNRHQYVDEMGVALERLAALVERVVNPPPDNVVPLKRVMRRKRGRPPENWRQWTHGCESARSAREPR